MRLPVAAKMALQMAVLNFGSRKVGTSSALRGIRPLQHRERIGPEGRGA
jgi:hypothetical protein